MSKRNHHKYVSLDAIENTEKDKWRAEITQIPYAHPKLMEKLRKVVYERDGLLSKQERLAVILYIYEGRNLKYCSNVMHCSEPAVLGYYKVAIKKLQEYFNHPKTTNLTNKVLKIKQAKVTRYHQNDSKY